MLISLYAICSEIFRYGIYVKLQALLEHRKHKEWLHIKGRQRYKCRECQKTYKSGDMRVKYSLDKKMKVEGMYLEGVGIRSIERLEKISSPLSNKVD